jgi:hypothetical protein
MVATRETGKSSFCKKWSNDSAWLAFTKKKWNAKEKFEAYSQGQEIQAEVNKANGKFTANAKPSDILKTNIWVALNDTLGKYSILFFIIRSNSFNLIQDCFSETSLGNLSYEICFPKTKDPVLDMRN